MLVTIGFKEISLYLILLNDSHVEVDLIILPLQLSFS